jgi:hypothetical protein
VKQIEDARAITLIFLVERLNALGRTPHQFFVAACAPGRVAKIGEQREIKVVIAIAR